MGFWSIFCIGFGVGSFFTALLGFVVLVLSDDVEADDIDEHARGGVG